MRVDTRYYQTGGLTLEVNSELPFTPDTFHPKFKQYQVEGPGVDNIVINHYFTRELNVEVTEKDRIYFKPPWSVYQNQDKMIYEWIQDDASHTPGYRKFLVNKAHTRLDTYNGPGAAEFFSKGMLTSLSLFPTDQILLSRALAFRQGCIMHSLGLIHQGKGYLFVGHSEAGKSTMAKIMKEDSIILCDDRNIIRKINSVYTLFGTWQHSDFSEISPLSAPLRGIFFLNKSDKNQIEPITDARAKLKLLLNCLIKPLATDDWWESTLDFMDRVSREVDCMDLKFDKSGKIKELIGKL